ncbi:MAG: hypothetical protein IJZ46_01965 [Bacilli bacterium]|nr:hypothetical protein [Bacilli bacterium]
MNYQNQCIQKERNNNICINYSISVGKNNRYGHPNKKVLNNLEDSNIYRTDMNGSVMFKIKNNNLKVETCTP